MSKLKQIFSNKKIVIEIKVTRIHSSWSGWKKKRKCEEFKIENVEAYTSPQNTKTFISRLVPHGSYIYDMS